MGSCQGGVLCQWRVVYRVLRRHFIHIGRHRRPWDLRISPGSSGKPGPRDRELGNEEVEKVSHGLTNTWIHDDVGWHAPFFPLV